MECKINLAWDLEDLRTSDAMLSQLRIYRDRSDNYVKQDPEINQYWHRAIERELKRNEEIKQFIKSMDAK